MSPTTHEVSIFNFGTVRRMRHLLTFGANPYYLMVDQLIVTLETKPTLWVSQLMAVTPSTLKSNGSDGNPAFSRKGTMKLPKQQST